jgi:gamma-glutamyltranspeptidase / glutathione hydrolase
MMNDKRSLWSVLSLILGIFIGILIFYEDVSLFPPQLKAENSENVQAQQVEETKANYGVSASHPLAVKVGMNILKKGGNAVDAAVAVSYALGVVEPYGSGIGGGGEMLVYPNDDRKPLVYQYREIAPLSGHIPENQMGIPGFVKGMEAVSQELGTMTMEELISPSIKLAEEGIKADPYLTERLEAAAYRMPIAKLPHFYPNGEAVQPGEMVVQTELADTLKLIQSKGSSAFYYGEIAEEIMKEVNAFQASDFANYAVVKAEPVYGEFAGYEVISAPPPLAGTTVIQSLQMAELLNIDSLKNNPTDFIHLAAEISKRTYDDRIGMQKSLLQRFQLITYLRDIKSMTRLRMKKIMITRPILLLSIKTA